MGAWWRNSEIVKELGLTDAQARQVEQIFQDHRAELLNLHTALSQQETQLQPLVAAQHPDDAQVFAQIDKVAESRAAVEKANSRMLFAIRQVLTVEQWQKLEQMGQGLGMGMGRGPGMGQGMGRGRGPGPQP
jgi:Spy/CpxP family protein refolding chaperone